MAKFHVHIWLLPGRPRRPSPAPPGQLEVISMLEGLQDKFVDERVSLEKEEAKKRHSYEAW